MNLALFLFFFCVVGHYHWNSWHNHKQSIQHSVVIVIQWPRKQLTLLWLNEKKLKLIYAIFFQIHSDRLFWQQTALMHMRVWIACFIVAKNHCSLYVVVVKLCELLNTDNSNIQIFFFCEYFHFCGVVVWRGLIVIYLRCEHFLFT